MKAHRCLPGPWGGCRQFLVLGGLSHLSLTSALPSLPISTGKGAPLQIHSRGRMQRERERGAASPKIHPSPPQCPSPRGRALLLTGDFQGAVELPPEPLQPGHCLQEKGSSLLWGRAGRAEVSSEATALSDGSPLVVPRLNSVPQPVTGHTLTLMSSRDSPGLLLAGAGEWRQAACGQRKAEVSQGLHLRAPGSTAELGMAQ